MQISARRLRQRNGGIIHYRLAIKHARLENRTLFPRDTDTNRDILEGRGGGVRGGVYRSGNRQLADLHRTGEREGKIV